MAEHVIEGTWEEIAEHGGQLSGKRVRLTILDEPYLENAKTTTTETKPSTEALAALTGVIDSRKSSSNSPRKRSAYGEAVVEKFRKQGLKLP
ncbi:MAG TPA: hypothetical protein VLU47_06115 [Blastocatellia bacterium]|nr:hypothetical protein [Blastocatellia bacterium]